MDSAAKRLYEREMLSWRNAWANVWAPRGTLHPWWGRKVIPPAPGHAENFGFICIEAEARRMWNTAGSGLADVVTTEAE